MTLKATFITLMVGVAVIVSFYVSYQLLFPAPKKVRLLESPVVGVVKPPKTSSIQAIAQVQAEERAGKALSIDGSQAFTMKTSSDIETTLYSFYRDDSLIFSLTASNSSAFSISDNAWDPGGRYVFIEKKQDGVRDDVVLKISGEEFSSGEKSIDVLDLYKQRGFPYTYKGATGWAATDLMMIDTANADGTPGPLFWFEVPSEAFIQLAR